ncbi:hypothetical protein BDQ17DRAFT_1334468 [Cyathus striatus]|nr:hypothetical protein BDQ17DRAFT_1334468 [Cyathus striatus]
MCLCKKNIKKGMRESMGNDEQEAGNGDTCVKFQKGGVGDIDSWSKFVSEGINYYSYSVTRLNVFTLRPGVLNFAHLCILNHKHFSIQKLVGMPSVGIDVFGHLPSL